MGVPLSLGSENIENYLNITSTGALDAGTGTLDMPHDPPEAHKPCYFAGKCLRSRSRGLLSRV